MPADGMSAAAKINFEEEEIGISPRQLVRQVIVFQCICIARHRPNIA
jgi:hypothetical protein